MAKKFILNGHILTILATIFGAVLGFFQIEAIFSSADVISQITVKLMKLVATPLLFLSIVSSLSQFKNFNDIKFLGKNIIKYTLLTTFIAAFVAEILFFLASPIILKESLYSNSNSLSTQKGFFQTLLEMVPDNFLGAFLTNNVLAIVIMAILLAIAILSLKNEEKELVFGFFVGLQNALMKLVHKGLKFIPIAVFAFVYKLFFQISSEQESSVNAIFGLTVTVISANLIQGLFILPILLVFKGINPLKLFKNVKEALILAFFTRSSSATMPVTLDLSIKNAQISEKVAKLSLPLCTTINMNGCAQFILLSVYFVSFHTGYSLDFFDHIAMIFVAVIAAVGNAGVPMGCFFLASSILASKDIPIYLMGTILPFYTFIDMVETSLNVWSDVCVTKIVDNKNRRLSCENEQA